MRRWHGNIASETPPITVVVAAYNRPIELLLCLAGYRRQSLGNFELILADDGSGPEVEEIFKRFSKEVSIPTTYLRQEDRGWGKLRMLNWAALEAKADYVCFTDGDCIPHRHFVRNHLEESDERTVQCGRRVDLMEKISPAISEEDVRSGRVDSVIWLAERILKDEVDFGWRGFHLPRILARMIDALRAPTLLGSNMSLHKKWLLELNGFDESFTVPGIGEDTDMQRRFEMAGLDVRWITYRAIQYHLWHPPTAVGKVAHEIFESVKSRRNKTALKGIKEFLPEFKSLGSGLRPDPSPKFPR